MLSLHPSTERWRLYLELLELAPGRHGGGPSCCSCVRIWKLYHSGAISRRD